MCEIPNETGEVTDSTPAVNNSNSNASDSNARALTLPLPSRRIGGLLRPNSFANFIGNKKKLKAQRSIDTAGGCSNIDNVSGALALVEEKGPLDVVLKDFTKGSVAVNIVLVEARGLPGSPDDGATHGIYCKLQLGSESTKSKTVPNTRQPVWRQRFKLSYQKSSLLQISLWDKGKQKNFMGSCDLDLSEFAIDRTHELWKQLDDGFGSVHLSVTLCAIRQDCLTLNGTIKSFDGVTNKYAWYNITDWDNVVGELQVKIIGAKGLSGRPNAYCIIELDNERVQTHCANGTAEPVWNKDYLFKVNDVTSSLDIKVYDNSLVNILQDGFLGRISIPLLRINNSEMHWYALKDKSKRSAAKGNCPRILLEMDMVWNPVKATMRMFQPKEVKYIDKPKKFNIALVYSNVEFVRDVFHLLVDANEGYKRLFEWENREMNTAAIICWLLFWFFFQFWMFPLLLVVPFVYLGLFHKDDLFEYKKIGENRDVDQQNEKEEKKLSKRITELPEMTLTITNGIEYMASLAEKLYNLASFKVPFLSVVTILLMIGSSIILYLVPFNYLLMAFGLHKFLRKHLNPHRELNNDVVDFISHIPDTDVLKNWKELNVPEPNQPLPSMNRVSRSSSMRVSN